jgi:hypothetical protein
MTGPMFDHAGGHADRRHRAFFSSSGELRQVWARRDDGQTFYLADGAVDDQIRADAHASRLTCPYPNCPDARFVAKGGPIRRHHFAHKIAGTTHNAAEGWRHQALLMLADWAARRYPQIKAEIDHHEGSLRLRSVRTGRELTLSVTYDPRRQSTRDTQLLVGHSRRLLLPREHVDGEPEQWWCGKGRLVGDLLFQRGWALAINPQERLIATLMSAGTARAAGMSRGPSHGELLCVVDDLENARLDGGGLHAPASDVCDKALARRRAAEAVRRRAAANRAAAAAKDQVRRSTESARTTMTGQAPIAEPATQRPLHAGPAGSRLEQNGAASTAGKAPSALSHQFEQDWPRDPSALRALLGDENLARQLERPLPSDVQCGQPAAIWHLMAALEYRKRNCTAHPLLIRAVLTVNGCSVRLTREAVEPVLAIVNRAS